MTALYLIFSLLAGVAFYLGVRHQQLWAAAQSRRPLMRALGWLCSALALAAAVVLLGVWAGVFAALTAIMLVLVALPYLDAARQLKKGKADVG